jgi:enamine deaminase RidA (YjgF/YER057c/UK114 family)
MAQSNPSPNARPAARLVTVPAGSSWLAVSATPSLAPGAVPPSVAEQAAAAWANLERALEAAGYTHDDLVSVTQYVTSAEDVPTCELARAAALRDARPACVLLVVAALGDPDHTVQLEAWAAKPSHRLHTTGEWEREARLTTDLGHRDSDEEDAYLRHQEEQRRLASDER